MVTKSTLLKKLSSYSALATVAVVANQNADGQIVYHAITPPKVLVIDSFYYLDLNGDTINDFVLALPPQFKTSNSTLSQVYAVAEAENSNFIERDTVVKFSSQSNFLKANNYKSVIGEGTSGQWEEKGELDFYTIKGKTKTGNNFAGKGDKYIGLKLKDAGKTYYGWIRVNLNYKCDTLIVKDYAYDTIPGDSITAGEGEPSAGIIALNTNEALLECYPNPATGTVNIFYTTTIASLATLELYDVTGRKIEILLNNTLQTPGRNRIPIDFSGLSDGIYFYKLTVNGQSYTQKLVVTH